MGFWITLFVNALFVVAKDIFIPKPKIEDAKPLGKGAIQLPTATEGRVVPLIWGTVEITGDNAIWYGEFSQNAIQQTIKTGIFSKETSTVGFDFFVSVQSALCQGPVDELRRVTLNDTLVVDATSSPITHLDTFTIDEPGLFGGDDGSGGWVGELQFFAGTNTQVVSNYLAGSYIIKAAIVAAGSGYAQFDALQVDTGDGTAITQATLFFSTFILPSGPPVILNTFPLLHPTFPVGRGLYTVQPSNPVTTTAVIGSGTGLTADLTFQNGPQVTGPGSTTAAYKDICYVTSATDSPLIGKSPILRQFKWEVRRVPNGLALAGGNHIVVQGANPANVLYEIFTNADWGYGIPTDEMDTTAMTTAGNTLFTEGNGFSFILDRAIDLSELVQIVERQIDGIMFINPLTSKWTLKLIRFDYDIETVDEMNSDNIVDLRAYTRQTIEQTTNQVRVPFVDQDDFYKDTFGFAQNMANVASLGNNVSTTINHPGIKNNTLANNVAWRELQTLSVPLSIGTWVVDRTFYGVLPGDVLAFTDPDLKQTKTPIRISSVDYGNLLNGEITLEGSEDIFSAADGSFGDPAASAWSAPLFDVTGYVGSDSVIFEAPYALVIRDPATLVAGGFTPFRSKLWAGARRKNQETSFKILERHIASPGTPIGDFVENGEVQSFMLVGQIASALNLSGTNPVTSIVVNSLPDGNVEMAAEFKTIVGTSELGIDLTTLCLIDDEFILVTSANTSGDTLVMNTVYRGVLDSVQADHLSGAFVFMLFIGSGIGDTDLPLLPAQDVDVKLLPRSGAEILAEGDATTVQITTAARTLRPYPPAAFDLNGVTLDRTDVDLDGSDSGGENSEDKGILVDEIIRRSFEHADEVEALSVDAAVIVPTFPGKYATTVQLDVKDGSTVLVSVVGLTEPTLTHIFLQNDILRALDTTTLPASLTIVARENHLIGGVFRDSLVDLECTFTVDSEFVGKTAFGALDNADVSAAFTVVADTVDHVFTLSSAFATNGDVEFQINAGAFSTLISQGGTTGTILAASLTNTDTIKIRHDSTESVIQKLIVMTVSSTEEAYGVLFT